MTAGDCHHETLVGGRHFETFDSEVFVGDIESFRHDLAGRFDRDAMSGCSTSHRVDGLVVLSRKYDGHIAGDHRVHRFLDRSPRCLWCTAIAIKARGGNVVSRWLREFRERTTDENNHRRHTSGAVSEILGGPSRIHIECPSKRSSRVKGIVSYCLRREAT